MQLSNLVFFIMVVAVFWFLVMRPQQQRVKQQKAMLDALRPGDEIVTVGGIFASVIEVGDRVRVRVVDGSEFEIAKQAIAQAVEASETAMAEPDGETMLEDSGEGTSEDA